MTTRVPDWQSRLQACLVQRWARPFAWGTQDCVMFAADCVDACTGVDPAADMRGRYTTTEEAVRLVGEMGGLAAIAAARCGEEIQPVFAQAGDVGLALSEGRECLVVYTGAVWHGPGLHALVAFPPEGVQRAWRLTGV